MSTDGAVATPSKGTEAGTATLPEKTRPRPLPLFRVILHNDDVNPFDHVIESIVLLTPLGRVASFRKTLEAHLTGCALLLVTHRERAELYVEQFQSRRLTITIEPAD
jgi:ATP-dependent Clp protease adaptor protein ClpS